MQKNAGLQVNVTSSTLRLSASANMTGLYVLSFVYVEDAGALYPEKILDGTATLLYRGEHALAAVSFDGTYAQQDGRVSVGFMQPAHTENLSIRIRATIDGLGLQTVTIPVLIEPEPVTALSESLFPPKTKAPRTELNSVRVLERTLSEDPMDRSEIDQDVDPILWHYDFSDAQTPFAAGASGPEYGGGGNRLLPSIAAGILTRQDADEAPTPNGLRTVIEPSSTNLLPQSTFLTAQGGVPAGLTLTTPPSVRTNAVETVAWVPGVARRFRVRLSGSGPYTGPSIVRLTSAVLAHAPATAMTLSILARTEAIIGTINDLRLRIDWLNAGGAVLNSSSVEYDPAAIQMPDFSLLTLTVPLASIPVGTAALRWSIELESVDGGDVLDLSLALPQLEPGPVATTRIPTGATAVSRAADRLTVNKAGNFEPETATVVIELTPQYVGSPAQNVTIFDTRGASGRSGWRAQHLTTGRLALTFVDAAGATTTVQTADAYAADPATPTILSFGWTESHARIFVEDDAWVDSAWSISVDAAAAIGNIALLSTVGGTEHCAAEITSAQIWREMR